MSTSKEALEHPGEGEIVAAINFDHRAPSLIQAAADLSRLRHLPLRLIHAIALSRLDPSALAASEDGFSPVPDAIGYKPLMPTNQYADGFLPDEMPRALNNSPAWAQQKAAEERLITLAEQYGGKGIDIRVEAVFGAFPEVILMRLDELLLNPKPGARPVLLIVSAPTKTPGFFKANLKPVQKLMAKSPIPVLILSDQSHPFEFGKRPLRLLVADDLGDETQKVISTTDSLVNALGLPVELRHIHVVPLATAGWALSPEYRMVVWPGIAVEDRLINDHHETLKDKLRRRGKALGASVQRFKGVYSVELWHGTVAEEIQRAVQVLRADVSIFGQHHFFHKNPVSFGQMSFVSMLGVESAVLIAPS